jgi:hypothetical protein
MRISMARRPVVESANSALKWAFADLGAMILPRVMSLVKTTVLLGFTLAAYNPEPYPVSNKGEARVGRRRPGGRKAQAAAGSAAHRHLARSHRNESGSPTDVAPSSLRPTSRPPSSGRFQRVPHRTKTVLLIISRPGAAG